MTWDAQSSFSCCFTLFISLFRLDRIKATGAPRSTAVTDNYGSFPGKLNGNSGSFSGLIFEHVLLREIEASITMIPMSLRNKLTVIEAGSSAHGLW